MTATFKINTLFKCTSNLLVKCYTSEWSSQCSSENSSREATSTKQVAPCSASFQTLTNTICDTYVMFPLWQDKILVTAAFKINTLYEWCWCSLPSHHTHAGTAHFNYRMHTLHIAHMLPLFTVDTFLKNSAVVCCILQYCIQCRKLPWLQR